MDFHNAPSGEFLFFISKRKIYLIWFVHHLPIVSGTEKLGNLVFANAEVALSCYCNSGILWNSDVSGLQELRHVFLWLMLLLHSLHIAMHNDSFCWLMISCLASSIDFDSYSWDLCICKTTLGENNSIILANFIKIFKFQFLFYWTSIITFILCCSCNNI